MTQKKMAGLVDNIVDADVMVVGGGLGGTAAAIGAADFVKTVVLVEKGAVARTGCSAMAAGVYTIFFPDEDDIDVWMKEIIELAQYFNHQEWLRLYLEKIHPLALDLDKWGQGYGLEVFVKDKEGNFVRRRSRGHLTLQHCVINALPMMETMKKKALERGVKLIERVMVTDLIKDGQRVVGAIGINPQSGETYLLRSKALIMAAGGCGFKGRFIGHRQLTGDGAAMAYRAGAVMQSMEQTESNTCAKDFDIHGLNLFVGVGGKLVNAEGEEFMWRYNPVLGNRALLSELVLAFCREVKEGRGPIYMDATAASKADQELMRKVLPESFRTWDSAGINPFQQKVEWVPAQAGYIGSGTGGTRINLKCETNVPGLYAVGDSAAQMHSAFGLGGTAITWPHVTGHIAGENAGMAVKDCEAQDWGKTELKTCVADALDRMLSPIQRTDGITPKEVTYEIQKIVLPSQVMYLRSEASLTEALDRLEDIKRKHLPRVMADDAHELVKANEVGNMALMAEMLLRSALLREESRGFHFREDYPRVDNKKWLKWVMLRDEEDEMKLWTEEIPTPVLKPSADVMIPAGIRIK